MVLNSFAAISKVYQTLEKHSREYFARKLKKKEKRESVEIFTRLLEISNSKLFATRMTAL